MVWALVAGALAGIIGLTLQSAAGTTALSNWFQKQLLKLVPEGSRTAQWIPENTRRLGHVPEYLLLGVTVCTAMAVTVKQRTYVYALLACGCASLGDQLLKAALPTRHFDSADLIMDFIGYGLGMTLVWAVCKINRK